MKVILLENIKRVGSIGEVIDVKRGFARNFLIANKKALYASKDNIKEVEKIKSDLAKKDNDKKTEASKIKDQEIFPITHNNDNFWLRAALTEDHPMRLMGVPIADRLDLYMWTKSLQESLKTDFWPSKELSR